VYIYIYLYIGTNSKSNITNKSNNDKNSREKDFVKHAFSENIDTSDNEKNERISKNEKNEKIQKWYVCG
jgi:hypothetical protein